MSNNLSLFIIGLPRSGTQLLRELLNNHDDIFIPSIEAYFIPHLVEKYGDKKLNKSEVVDVIEEISNSLFFFYYSQDKTINFKKFIAEHKTVKEILGEIWCELALNKEKKTVRILGDKTPRNIYWLPFLLNSFTEAKFIHIVRDPRDNVLSARNKWDKNIFRAAYKWQQGVDMIEKIDNGSDRLVEITYEDLLRDTEKVLKYLCSFLGIEYKEKMDRLNIKLEKEGGGVDKTNFNKYSIELRNDEIKYIEKLTKKGLQKYEYRLKNAKVQFEDHPSAYKLLYWKLQDIINLLSYNIKEHGFAKGIEKIIKARKHA